MSQFSGQFTITKKDNLRYNFFSMRKKLISTSILVFVIIGAMVGLLRYGQGYGIQAAVLNGLLMAVSGTALVVLPFVEGLLPIAIITVLIAPILGSGTITQSHLIQGIPNDIKGTGLGVVRTGGMAIAAVSPAIFGTIADWGYFDEVFLFLAGLAACIMLFVRRIPPGEHHYSSQ